MTPPPPPEPTRAWMEVDLGALVRNARRLAGEAGTSSLLPMVKADAYGLGAVPVARALAPLDPYAFGVASAAEGRELREAGIEGRIVVFFPWAEAEAGIILEWGLDAAILGLASLDALAQAAEAAGRPLDVHLEIDTGMGRGGLPAARAAAWAPRATGALEGGSLRLASAFTHFCSGEDRTASDAQLGRFEKALEALGRAGLEPPIVHVANSDAAIRAPSYHPGLVRPGIWLYGGRRGTGMSSSLGDPEPVVRVGARVLEVRHLAPGSSVGYGATYVTTGTERIATLAIGYADGLPWRLSNRGHALVGGVRAPIRGSVCMDVTAVDVSEVQGVEPGTVATLMGADGDEEIGLGEWAEADGTIEYEVLTGLGRRLPRRYAGAEAARSRSGA